MIRGFVTGSFRPFHKGHEALIEYAKKNCDKLLILVTTLPDEIICYKHRLSWVLSTYLNDPQVDVVNAIIEEPKGMSYDGLSMWWGEYVRNTYGKFDRVFTSEDYGEIFALYMGAEHFPFNKDRNLVPISATEIREKPFSNWKYINNFAKDYFVKKIAIVGTESTGKTVLAKELANYFHTNWCPEVGRNIAGSSTNVTLDQLKLIGEEHAKSILRHTRDASKILFVDTDLNITQSYSKFIFGHDIAFPNWIEEANKCDLYIYLDSATPYIDDGTRFDEHKRNLLDVSHIRTFAEKGIVLRRFTYDNSLPTIAAYAKRFYEIASYISHYINKF